MKDIPIIFSAPMILALLAGRKTMTRRLLYSLRLAKEDRVCNPIRLRDHEPPLCWPDAYYTLSGWQRVQPGDRLWVRENLCAMANWGLWHDASDAPPSGKFLDEIDDRGRAILERYAPTEATDSALVPSIYMPRWASRLTLIVTATKIERLNDISEQDCFAEGVTGEIVTEATGERRPFGPVALMNFGALWEKLHGEGSWLANPEVVAISFRVVKQNIDAMPKEQAA